MTVYICNVCNVYVFDEEQGEPSNDISPNTSLADLPEAWRCPVCGAEKDLFESVQ